MLKKKVFSKKYFFGISIACDLLACALVLWAVGAALVSLYGYSYDQSVQCMGGIIGESHR